jgi:hypothetical protein
MNNRLELQINGYDPSGASMADAISLDSRSSKRFALREKGQPAGAALAPGPVADLNDFAHADVGWGLIVPATMTTLPPALQALVHHRQGEVFHYLPDWERRQTFLRNPALNRDVAIAASARGKGPGKLPYYLMIYGGPEEIPWALQFSLAATRAVGRLPLVGAALDNYVNAVLSDFGNEPADPYTTVTWSVDTSPGDISHLMRDHLAAKLHRQFLDDKEMGLAKSVFLDGGADPRLATTERLMAELKTRRPGLIITTSHGMTGPLSEIAQMRRTMGLPVDQNGSPLLPDVLLDGWRPGGAIWYCHACCSAGSEAPSFFAPLFEDGSRLRAVLDGIAAAGSLVAPLPMQLLGDSNPARAFIGHVEPTFDWTLRNPGNKQVMTAPIVDAIYPRLFQRPLKTPVGHAFREVHNNIGGYLAAWEQASELYAAGSRNLGDLLAMQLAARDLQSLVIIGDPAVSLPLNV